MNTQPAPPDKSDKLELSDKKRNLVELWRTTRGHISDACAGAMISRDTYYTWLKEDPNFAYAIAEAEAELNDDMRDALISKGADGDVGAIKYYLDRRHPDFKPQPTTLIQNNFGGHAKKELEDFTE